MYFYRTGGEILYLSMRFDEDMWLEDLLDFYSLPADTTQLTAQFRIAVKAGDTVIIADEFDVTVTPVIDITNSCEDASTAFITAANNKTVAFGEK
jgi:hypothetical protein